MASRRTFLLGAAAQARSLNAAVLISANAEWREVRKYFASAMPEKSPYGEWFEQTVAGHRVLFFHGGWGKIDAAGSTQFVVDRWSPPLLFNLGTCGGFRKRVERLAILLIEKTVVYDLYEQMSDPKETIEQYTTKIDLSWLRIPAGTKRATLASGDRDVLAADVEGLASQYGAIAADWESGAIARVAARNRKRLVILRGVTDLVGSEGGEAYGNVSLFEKNTAIVMKNLLDALPQWLVAAGA